MGKITVVNNLPASCDYRYTATDGTSPLQHLNADAYGESSKELENNSTVIVSSGGSSQSTQYSLAYSHLYINPGLPGGFSLQWS